MKHEASQHPRRLRIAIVGESPCSLCHANCCKQNGHEFAALLQSDEELRRFAAFAMDVNVCDERGGLVAERVLPYFAGRCQFLGSDDRCTIYEDRPLACRQFQCVTELNRHGIGKHGVFLQRNPDVLELLTSNF